MNFQTSITRKSKKNWNMSEGANTVVSDGYVGSETRYSPKVSNETIIRDYLAGYGVTDPLDKENESWWEVTIVKRPWKTDDPYTFYVKRVGEHSVVVTTQTPVGGYRTDGYRY